MSFAQGHQPRVPRSGSHPRVHSALAIRAQDFRALQYGIPIPVPPSPPHLLFALLADKPSHVEAFYGLYRLLLNLSNLNSFWEVASFPNHAACSHLFLAHISVFPLIQSSECGRNEGFLWNWGSGVFQS